VRKKKLQKTELPPVELRHIDSGEMWMVPGDVFAKGGAAATRWIDERIKERKTAEFFAAEEKREAEQAAAAKAEAEKLAAKAGERTMEDVLAENAKLLHRITKLENSVDGYKHRLQVKEELLTELGAAHNLRNINAEPLEQLKQDMAQKAEEAKRRKARNSELFDRIRAGEFVPESAFQAPLPPPAPAVDEEAADA